MGEKIVIGPLTKGLRNDVTAFNIDNDSFPELINAYQWRGRVKRKRGTIYLNRLSVAFSSTNPGINPGSATQTLGVGGTGNLLTGFTSLESTATIVPRSISILDTTNMITYSDDGNGNLTGGSGGTINYSTGAFVITGRAGDVVSAQFNYYPGLPVMGIKVYNRNTTTAPLQICFDTSYCYTVVPAPPYLVFLINNYLNPLPSPSLPGYVKKTVLSRFKYAGTDYQQFWTLSYETGFFATNGIAFSFDPTKVQLPFKKITGVTITSAGPPAIASLTIVGHGLIVGDFIFINEVQGITGINFQTAYVITVTDANTVVVEFPLAALGETYTANTGIAVYLTSSSASPTTDNMRFYDGNGWVNFCPPLSNADFGVGGLPSDQYYLVTARMIVPFKDRLLFIGPVVQSSSSAPIYLSDTVIYSQNGTPYYTASFNGVPGPLQTYQPMLVSTNQTAQPTAWWEDQTGLGGYVPSGFQDAINSVSPNEDVLIMGFGSRQARFVYTGSDLFPFDFYVINSELGTTATFSTINLDRMVLNVGLRGIVGTSQIETKRIDLDIPNQVFQINLSNEGTNRICSGRDFKNEWIYFTYSSDEWEWVFPTQTLQYNYREASWAIFDECYTCYGQFYDQGSLSWAQAMFPWDGADFTWSDNITLEPSVLAGNQQGFLILRENEVATESPSLFIQNISGATVTSPNHCLNANDYIIINGCIGTGGSTVNGKVFQVNIDPESTDTFTLDYPAYVGTYLGGGTITRCYVPFIQSKQFPVAWGGARKTRLGPQMYLLTTTNNSQITLLIYLSQNNASPYNDGPIVPANDSTNNSLIYSTVLYTCPESTNLGLTPANTNLQMLTAAAQSQIWHRVNTSLLGDTVQLGFTMNDAQMRDPTLTNQFAEIELHSIILDVAPSMLLS